MENHSLTSFVERHFKMSPKMFLILFLVVTSAIAEAALFNLFGLTVTKNKLPRYKEPHVAPVASTAYAGADTVRQQKVIIHERCGWPADYGYGFGGIHGDSVHASSENSETIW